MDHLVQIILLLAVAVAIMVIFQRLHIPSSLGYLLVGLVLGPHTAGPTVHVAEFEALAEFGRSAIPFYAVYGRDPQRAPTELPAILTPGLVLSALDKVR